MERKNKITLIGIYLCLIMLLLTLFSTSLAYFKFSTYYYSEGNLPYLKLHANVESINGSKALTEILYLGQNEQIEVKFSTAGNTISGKLRVIVMFEWDDLSLKNNPENADGQKILAATIELANPDLFDVSGNTFYLKENFKPNEEITFMTAVKFAEDLPSEYLGHKVQVYILADLIQVNKGW